MNSKLNIGILGTASIAKKYILDTIYALDDYFSIAGIASRNLLKANVLAEKYNTTPYGDYDSLIEKGNLDALYIPLPNSLHYEWVKEVTPKH